MVRLAEEANRAVASRLEVAAGALRVTADPTLGEALLRALVSDYARAFPQVEVDLLLTSRKVDLLREGFDVAFRVGPPPDVHHLAARRLTDAELWWVAAPSYLTERGTPAHVRALAEHACIASLPDGAPAAWPVREERGLRLSPVRPRIRSNHTPTVREAALAGLGIAQVPSLVVRADVAAGRLVRVLADHSPEVGGIHVVYPHSRLLDPKVTEFVAMAVARADRLQDS